MIDDTVKGLQDTTNIALTTSEILKLTSLNLISISRVLEGESSALITEGASNPFHTVSEGDNKNTLWVSEAHRPIGWDFDNGMVHIQYSDKSCLWVQEEVDYSDPTAPNDNYMIAICDELDARGVSKLASGNYDLSVKENLPKWRSAHKMPQWASRLSIEIIDAKSIANKDSKGLPITEWILTIRKAHLRS